MVLFVLFVVAYLVLCGVLLAGAHTCEEPPVDDE